MAEVSRLDGPADRRGVASLLAALPEHAHVAIPHARDDRRRRAPKQPALDKLHQLQAVEPGHVDRGHDEIDVRVDGCPDGVETILCTAQVEPGGAQHLARNRLLLRRQADDQREQKRAGRR
jgi:hypothetical protein